jgi:hypothetical protein
MPLSNRKILTLTTNVRIMQLRILAGFLKTWWAATRSLPSSRSTSSVHGRRRQKGLIHAILYRRTLFSRAPQVGSDVPWLDHWLILWIGTGKTTTARKISQVYFDMGFLSSTQVIESSASDLVAQYVGQVCACSLWREYVFTIS